MSRISASRWFQVNTGRNLSGLRVTGKEFGRALVGPDLAGQCVDAAGFELLLPGPQRGAADLLFALAVQLGQVPGQQIGGGDLGAVLEFELGEAAAIGDVSAVVDQRLDDGEAFFSLAFTLRREGDTRGLEGG
jgi:hypothetical protein